MGNEIPATALHLPIRKFPLPAPSGMYSIQYIDTTGLCVVDDAGNALPIAGISRITCNDESILVTNPTGPITDLILAGPPGPNMVLWFRADAGVTLNAGRVTDVEDQGPNGWDVHAVNSSGAPVAAPQRPGYDAGVINGLPGFFYSDTGPGTALGTLNHLAQASPTPVPLAGDAPRTLLALIKRNNSYGGIVFTCRLAGVDHEFGLWNNTPTQLYAFVSSTNGCKLDDLNMHINEPIVVRWQFYGIGASPTPLRVYINGVEKSWTLSGPLQLETGSYGFSLGNVNSVGASRGFSGWITEFLMYSGTDTATALQAENYLMRRGGLV